MISRKRTLPIQQQQQEQSQSVLLLLLLMMKRLVYHPLLFDLTRKKKKKVVVVVCCHHDWIGWVIKIFLLIGVVSFVQATTTTISSPNSTPLSTLTPTTTTMTTTTTANTNTNTTTQSIVVVTLFNTLSNDDIMILENHTNIDLALVGMNLNIRVDVVHDGTNDTNHSSSSNYNHTIDRSKPDTQFVYMELDDGLVTKQSFIPPYIFGKLVEHNRTTTISTTTTTKIKSHNPTSPSMLRSSSSGGGRTASTSPTSSTSSPSIDSNYNSSASIYYYEPLEILTTVQQHTIKVILYDDDQFKVQQSFFILFHTVVHTTSHLSNDETQIIIKTTTPSLKPPTPTRTINTTTAPTVLLLSPPPTIRKNPKSKLSSSSSSSSPVLIVNGIALTSRTIDRNHTNHYQALNHSITIQQQPSITTQVQTPSISPVVVVDRVTTIPSFTPSSSSLLIEESLIESTEAPSVNNISTRSLVSSNDPSSSLTPSISSSSYDVVVVASPSSSIIITSSVSPSYVISQSGTPSSTVSYFVTSQSVTPSVQSSSVSSQSSTPSSSPSYVASPSSTPSVLSSSVSSVSSTPSFSPSYVASPSATPSVLSSTVSSISATPSVLSSSVSSISSTPSFSPSYVASPSSTPSVLSSYGASPSVTPSITSTYMTSQSSTPSVLSSYVSSSSATPSISSSDGSSSSATFLSNPTASTDVTKTTEQPTTTLVENHIIPFVNDHPSNLTITSVLVSGTMQPYETITFTIRSELTKETYQYSQSSILSSIQESELDYLNVDVVIVEQLPYPRNHLNESDSSENVTMTTFQNSVIQHRVPAYYDSSYGNLVWIAHFTPYPTIPNVTDSSSSSSSNSKNHLKESMHYYWYVVIGNLSTTITSSSSTNVLNHETFIHTTFTNNNTDTLTKPTYETIIVQSTNNTSVVEESLYVGMLTIEPVTSSNETSSSVNTTYRNGDDPVMDDDPYGNETSVNSSTAVVYEEEKVKTIRIDDTNSTLGKVMEDGQLRYDKSVRYLRFARTNRYYVQLGIAIPYHDTVIMTVNDIDSINQLGFNTITITLPSSPLYYILPNYDDDRTNTTIQQGPHLSITQTLFFSHVNSLIEYAQRIGIVVCIHIDLPFPSTAESVNVNDHGKDTSTDTSSSVQLQLLDYHYQYYRDIVARFAYHLAIVWEIGTHPKLANEFVSAPTISTNTGNSANTKDVTGTSSKESMLLKYKENDIVRTTLTMSAYIYDIDPLKHPIIIDSVYYSGTKEYMLTSKQDGTSNTTMYSSTLMNSSSVIVGASLQHSIASGNKINTEVMALLHTSKNVSVHPHQTNQSTRQMTPKPIVIFYKHDLTVHVNAMIPSYATAYETSSNIMNAVSEYNKTLFSTPKIRSHIIWGSLIAGCTGIEYNLGSIRNIQFWKDSSSILSLIEETRNAIDLFSNILDPKLSFESLVNVNHLLLLPTRNENSNVVKDTSNSTIIDAAYCIAESVNLTKIIVYLQHGDTSITGMDLSSIPASRAYTILWYNPRNGGALLTGSIVKVNGGHNTTDIGLPPTQFANDWVVVLGCTANCSTDIAMENVKANSEETSPPVLNMNTADPKLQRSSNPPAHFTKDPLEMDTRTPTTPSSLVVQTSMSLSPSESPTVVIRTTKAPSSITPTITSTTAKPKDSDTTVVPKKGGDNKNDLQVDPTYPPTLDGPSLWAKILPSVGADKRTIHRSKEEHN